jgi:ABC-2 type transport system ATP-binding protein
MQEIDSKDFAESETAESSSARIVRVESLEKTYSGRNVKAVAGVSFVVQPGEVFGLLGPNGAGKTTTIGILTTRILPTGGRAFVADIDVVRDPVAVKPHIAVVPQRNNLDRSLTARENLIFHAAYFGISRRERHERAERLLTQFGLIDRADEKVMVYSGGMAQRLLIARTLMHDPDILFLDEPTAGLDPQSRLFLWDIIRDLHARGLTVLLTTHDMEEAEKLCGRVAIMDHGKILALDTPRKLSQLVPSGTRVELKTRRKEGQPPSEHVMASILSKVRAIPGVTSGEWAKEEPMAAGQAPFPGNGGAWGAGPPAMPDKARAMASAGKAMAGPARATAEKAKAMAAFFSAPPQATGGDAVSDDDGPMLRLYSEGGGEVAVRAAQVLLDEGIELADVHLYRPGLEDVFIYLTGRGLRN